MDSYVKIFIKQFKDIYEKKEHFQDSDGNDIVVFGLGGDDDENSGGITFKNIVIQGVVVQLTDEKATIDDGTDLLDVSVAINGGVEFQFELGQYLLIGCELIAYHDNDDGQQTELNITKIKDLSDYPNRESIWYLEVVHLQKSIYSLYMKDNNNTSSIIDDIDEKPLQQQKQNETINSVDFDEDLIFENDDDDDDIQLKQQQQQQQEQLQNNSFEFNDNGDIEMENSKAEDTNNNINNNINEEEDDWGEDWS
eukprot:gene3785-4710_t